MRILGIFTSFNRREKSIKAVTSLREGNPSLQIDFLVADDSSKDGTGKALEAIPGVSVMYGDGNSYYTGGMRIAMGFLLENKEKEPWNTYDYILLCNDDVEFDAEAIENLVSQSQKKQKVVGKEVIYVGPTKEPTGELSYGGVIKRSSFRPKHRIVMADTPEGLRVDTFNANCVLIPWKIFVALGNMDPVYHHSLGDFDYGLNATERGYEAYVSDRFVGICADNPTEGGWRDSKLSRRERFRAKESIKGVPFKEWWHYLCKHYNIITAVIYSFSPYIRILMGI